MSEIENLYNNMDILREDFAELPETREASDRLHEELGRDFMIEHEDVIVGHAAASEKQGFIHGFQYAISLMMEGRREHTDNRE